MEMRTIENREMNVLILAVKPLRTKVERGEEEENNYDGWQTV